MQRGLVAARPRRDRLRSDGRVRGAARSWRSSATPSATQPFRDSSSPICSARRSISAARSPQSATALAIGVVARRGGLRFDTAVGVLFAGMFALGVLLFSTIKGYVTDLFGYLLGNVLGIGSSTSSRSRSSAVSSCVVVAILARSCCSPRSTRRAPQPPGCPWRGLDYLLLGLIGVTIVVSIQAVGIIMVVAMLVTPAATGQLLVSGSGPRKMAIGVALARFRSRASTSASTSTSRRAPRSCSSRRSVRDRAAVLAEVRLAPPAGPPDDECSHRRAGTGHLNLDLLRRQEVLIQNPTAAWFVWLPPPLLTFVRSDTCRIKA